MESIYYRLRRYSSGLLFFSVGFVLVASALLPTIISRDAGAAQLTSRSLTLSSGIPGQTSVNYTYGFTYVSSASAIQSIKFVACTTAVDTYGRSGSSSTSGCTAPTGMTINAGTQQGTVGGSWTNTTGFTRDTSTIGNCAPAANVLCITRTQAAAESAAAKTVTWNTQTNPTTANTAFFVGMYLYSNTGYSTFTDSGTVASAVVQTLTVNAAVTEILNFCTGTTTSTNNNATSSVASDCTGVSGTSINIGTLDSSSVNISPVSINGGNDSVALAMLRTNAVNGATVSYDAIQQSGTNHQGTLRISGASCDAGTTSTDQCINAAGTTQSTFVAGTEEFGMTVAGINCGSTTSYTCVFSSGTYNLVRDANYNGRGDNTYGSDITDEGFAWDETSTFDQIASSTGSATKVVDDEVLMMHFAATPSITTPFGAYAAQADFVAVATY